MGLTSFREALQSDRFTISAELTVRRDSTADDIRRQADRLAGLCDGIQVSDNPHAWVQMSALSAAGILIEHGADPVPVLTCRDRNRLALHSDLLGFHALGVSSLLLMRGHRVPVGHSVPASTVFDLTGRELIALAKSISPAGSAGESPFFIGTGVRVFRPNRGWQADSLTARAEVGARFAQTQLCFNTDMLAQYMKRFVAAGMHRRYALIVSLSPLPSVRTARWVKENLGDSRIPNRIFRRLEDAADPGAEGIRICAELMQKLSGIEGISGVNLMTTGNAEAIRAAISASGLRS
jgi:methylenetetrahydrofolate reductase (NADPH)